MKIEFRGSFVAIVTPFKKEGKIDRKALEKIVAWQIEQGSDGIVCCGATGEGIALSEKEKLEAVRICLSAAGKKLLVIGGSGTASTAESVKLTEKMGKLGVAGALVVTPYYNKPTAKGCIAHYTEVAKTGVPLIPYYNPKRTGVVLKPEALGEIGAIRGVAALKDSGGDIEFTKKLKQLSPAPILSGDDDMTFETLEAGGVGAISVIGNVFPKQWKEMIDLGLKRKWKEAKRINDRFMPLCKAMFIEPNPQCIKWLGSWLGINPPYMRLPLLMPEESTRSKIRGTFIRMGLPQFQIVTEEKRAAFFR